MTSSSDFSEMRFSPKVGSGGARRSVFQKFSACLLPDSLPTITVGRATMTPSAVGRFVCAAPERPEPIVGGGAERAAARPPIVGGGADDGGGAAGCVTIG